MWEEEINMFFLEIKTKLNSHVNDLKTNKPDQSTCLGGCKYCKHKKDETRAGHKTNEQIVESTFATRNEVCEQVDCK